jgi:hypothetical protein
MGTMQQYQAGRLVSMQFPQSRQFWDRASAFALHRISASGIRALFLNGSVLLVNLQRSRLAIQKIAGQLNDLSLGGSGYGSPARTLLFQFPAIAGFADVIVIHKASYFFGPIFRRISAVIVCFVLT